MEDNATHPKSKGSYTEDKRRAGKEGLRLRPSMAKNVGKLGDNTVKIKSSTKGNGGEDNVAIRTGGRPVFKRNQNTFVCRGGEKKVAGCTCPVFPSAPTFLPTHQQKRGFSSWLGGGRGLRKKNSSFRPKCVPGPVRRTGNPITKRWSRGREKREGTCRIGEGEGVSGMKFGSDTDSGGGRCRNYQQQEKVGGGGRTGMP